MNWLASQVLDAVEQWAGSDYWLCRETETLVRGRIDALLVPISFHASTLKRTGGGYANAARVAGIEVKTSRQDFLKGLRSGQFERYEETLSGLYIATPPGICKTKELPESCGHLTIPVYRPPCKSRCVCRRHPEFTDHSLSPYDMWRLFFRFAEEARRREFDLQRRQHQIMERIGHAASSRIFATLKHIEREAEEFATRQSGPDRH